jgi:hypothetical protein
VPAVSSQANPESVLQPTKIKLDSGFRASRESHWVPAFAGMTNDGIDQGLLDRPEDCPD